MMAGRWVRAGSGMIGGHPDRMEHKGNSPDEEDDSQFGQGMIPALSTKCWWRVWPW